MLRSKGGLAVVTLWRIVKGSRELRLSNATGSVGASGQFRSMLVPKYLV